MNPTKMTYAVETITPSKAAEILATKNPCNRPLSRDRISRYADEIREGRWHWNTQGIVFDEAGELVDGQHRLQAIVQADMPVQVLVWYNVPREASQGIDQGLTRTAAQMLAVDFKREPVEHEAPVSRLTSAARIILEYGLEHPKPSNTEINLYARKHLDVLDRYGALGKLHTAGVHAAFAFAELSGLKGVREAAERLGELRWADENDPMRALARSLSQMPGQGAKAQRTRFFTALAALQYVDRDEGLQRAIKYDTMPQRVQNVVGKGSNKRPSARAGAAA